MPNIRKGTRFNTAYESGCIALEEPDDDGSFAGLDSDGARVLFHTVMVRWHRRVSR